MEFQSRKIYNISYYLASDMKIITLILLSFFCLLSGAQNYTSYLTGSATDVVTQPDGGVCLMGGATEDDNAMTWFLEQANGGDILVLRASGSDGYNDYFYTDLGVTVNSVETIVFNDATASSETYIHQKLNKLKPFGLQVVINGIIFPIGAIRQLIVSSTLQLLNEKLWLEEPLQVWQFWVKYISQLKMAPSLQQLL
jgi:hypothetical protein